MQSSIEISESCYNLAQVCKVKFKLGLQPQDDLVEAIMWLPDGDGYHVADPGWKRVHRKNHSVIFRVQFTKIGKVELNPRYDVKYTQSGRCKYLLKPSSPLSVQVLPPFLSPAPAYQNTEGLDLAGIRENVGKQLNDKLVADNLVSWIWLSGLPGSGKTILLEQMKQQRASRGDLIRVVSFVERGTYDLPAYAAQSLGLNGSPCDTGEEQLWKALERILSEAREKANERGDDKQIVIIVFDELHKLLSEVNVVERFVDVVKTLKKFADIKLGTGRGKDNRIHWRVVFSHRQSLKI